VFTPTRASGLVYGPGNLPPVVGYPAILGNVDALRYYQRTLAALGYDLGPRGADGVWGDLTRRAVRAYQQRKGLAVDGILGPDTQRALQAEPMRPAPAVAQPAVQRPPLASEWDTVPTTRVDIPWVQVPVTRSFMDNLTIAPSVAAPSGTSPWVAVAAIAAGLTGLIALARYYDEKKTR
jgi:hypothetical protein